MKAKTKKGIKYTLLSALVALVGTVTIAASNPDFALGRNIQILFNMFRELNLLYVDQIDPDEMLLDAADGMTSKLDPYTELIPEKEMADFEIMTTGKYGGMGAMIRQKDDYVMIAQPYKNSPADKAGLVVGDLLLEVNGESIKGYEVSKVSSMLKGTPGTTLHLKVRKLLTGQEEELTFKRERIVVSGIPYWSVIDDSIGYIVHKDFSEDCSNDIRNAVMSMKKAGIKGLIIDLRGNGGGILQEAVKILSMFVPKGTEVVSMRGRMKELDATFVTQSEPIDTQIPVAVLINSSSASAAEIVAGAFPGPRPRRTARSALVRQGARTVDPPGRLQRLSETHHCQILHPQRTLHPGDRLFASGRRRQRRDRTRFADQGVYDQSGPQSVRRRRRDARHSHARQLLQPFHECPLRKGLYRRLREPVL